MRTARSLTVSPYLVVSHARPPGSNHTPPGATMHELPPQSNHLSTPPTPQEQPRMPPPRATTHAPPWTECEHTLLKILPCPNFVAGGNKQFVYQK